jgi:signal transduction histidine kinase
MQIRTKLTLQFLLLGGIIMIVASIIIFLSSARFYRNDFYDLLRSSARSVTQLALDSYEFNVNRAMRAGTDHPRRLQDEKIMILSFTNDTLYISDRSWELKMLNTIAGQVKSNGEVFTRQDQYEVLGTLYSTGSYQFVVIAAAIDNDGPLRIAKLRNLLIIVCLIGLLMFAVAGWFYSGRALRPISNVVKKVEEISITSLHLRVPEGNGTDEIGRLAKTFNKMLERLESSFAMQKNFIANASHELRTPLTSINGQIEVLMMKDRSTSEYKSALESVLEDIRSLIDLSNRLLLIARTSAENPAIPENKIRIDEVLWQARDEIRKFNNDFHINIFIDDSLTDSEQMMIAGDEYLLKVAVSNIIENACKFSPDHSVNINLEHTENSIEVIFEDKGIGISEADMAKIFEPFYRGANTVSVPGTGIGLSLVKRIIENQNGTIIISSQAGKGTAVRIKFPTVF